MGIYNPDVVSVSVTYDTVGVSAQGFSTPLFIANHNVFTNRQVAYTGLTDLTEAGFAVGSPVYNWASGVFGGNKNPSFILVGRAVPSAYTTQVDITAVEDDVLSMYVKLNGVATTVEYTVLSTDVTPQLLGDGLATELGLVTGITAVSTTSDPDGLVTITLDDDTLPTTFGVKENTVIYTTTAEAPADILAAIDNENTDYAIVCSESHDTSTQEAYATYIETADKMYFFSSQDPDAYDPVATDDIFYKYSDAAYKYSSGLYYSTADTDFPEAHYIGTFSSQSPAINFTANMQTLTGLSTDTLTTSQKIALTAKNASFYIEEYSVGVLHEGWVGNSDLMDRTRFGLWLKVRTAESLFTTLKSKATQGSSLGYIDAGIAIAKAKLITDVINVGISGGTILTGSSTGSDGLVVSYSPVINTSTRAAQTTANIASRTWKGFEITVYYTGSIHHIDVDAYILNS